MKTRDFEIPAGAPDWKRGLGGLKSQEKARKRFEDLVGRDFEALEDVHKLAGGRGAAREELVAVAAVTTEVEGHLVSVDAVEFVLGNRDRLLVFFAGSRREILEVFLCRNLCFMEIGFQYSMYQEDPSLRFCRSNRLR